MRVGFLSLALIVVAIASAPGSPASATGIAFAQSQQPRNQAQPQEGLPPDKKKTLSGFGPEDVFGVTGEDPRNRQPGKPQRKPQPTPAFQSAAPQKPSATSAASPSAQPSATPGQSSVAEPSPTVAAASIDMGSQQPALGRGDSSDKIIPKWAAPTGLILLALLVSVALIITLTKLVEKIREGSSG
jgi:hypothetical protein